MVRFRASLRGWLRFWGQGKPHLVAVSVGIYSLALAVALVRNVIADVRATIRPRELAFAWLGFGLGLGLRVGLGSFRVNLPLLVA